MADTTQNSRIAEPMMNPRRNSTRRCSSRSLTGGNGRLDVPCRTVLVDGARRGVPVPFATLWSSVTITFREDRGVGSSAMMRSATMLRAWMMATTRTPLAAGDSQRPAWRSGWLAEARIVEHNLEADHAAEHVPELGTDNRNGGLQRIAHDARTPRRWRCPS